MVSWKAPFENIAIAMGEEEVTAIEVRRRIE
jgi:hypothetical protein